MITAELLLKKKQKKKRIFLIFFLASLLFIIGIAYFLNYQKNKSSFLLVGEAKTGTILEAVYGLGTITAQNTYQLKLGISGKIGNLFVKEGQKIKKGDKLLSISGAATFYAPFAGTVTSLPFHISETVFPQVSLLTLTDLTHNYVLVSLEQESALKVKPNQEAIMNFEGQREQKIYGIVTSVYPNESQFYVQIDSKSFPQNILPGMTVDVAIKIGEKKNALLIPASGVQSDKNVFIMRNHKKLIVPVKTGLIDSGFAEIISGNIQAGDQILLRKN